MIPNTPWSQPIEPQIYFPTIPYNKLLESLDWANHIEWLNYWLKYGGVNLAASAWPVGTKKDWAWGLGLPFLSDVQRFIFKEERILFGISGLPGCGKTSFGRWLEASASELKWPLKVISMDDFYLDSEGLDKAMAGNPWNVPRALPGSHSIDLLEETIENWKSIGHLKAPKFDKALRNGLGDRCGWSYSAPQVLVIEGWFLGCGLSDLKSNSLEDNSIETTSLSSQELDYQYIVQSALKDYQSIWSNFQRIWHIKAIDFTSTRMWKSQQEIDLQKERGASISGKSLDLFIRMIETAIPQKDLQSIKSDVTAELNSSRSIRWVGQSKDLSTRGK
ncbi:uridine kinase [Prochlorococcus sp. MIT 1300]|uniref:uridine kinase n=1 Tax=Prochlorococcus sp. MIT 1300 TaxID=3096218 RepID=UPI002A757B6C|nr:uridine kinase [Prochlorococcus sp. MIT 1300]